MQIDADLDDIHSGAVATTTTTTSSTAPETRSTAPGATTTSTSTANGLTFDDTNDDEVMADVNEDELAREMQEASAIAEAMAPTSTQRVRIIAPVNNSSVNENDIPDDGELHTDGLDEDELDGYFNTLTETEIKTTLWEEMHKDFLEKLRQQEEENAELLRQGKQPKVR